MADPQEYELPPTPFELEQRRHQITLAQNDERERRRLRKANQANGHDEPTPGTVLHVQLDGSVTRRNRAGIRFERNTRVPVLVVEGDEFEIAARRGRGEMVVSVQGAEQIYADTALHVFGQASSDADVDTLRSQKDTLEEELRVMRSENDALNARIKAARLAAPESTDGRPTRLRAAAAARGGTEGPPAEFGANPDDKK